MRNQDILDVVATVDAFKQAIATLDTVKDTGEYRCMTDAQAKQFYTARNTLARLHNALDTRIPDEYKEN